MDADLASLYRDHVRMWARKVHKDRRLAKPDVTLARTSRACGSRLTLDLIFKNDHLFDIGWMARTCTLGMASTAVFVASAPGLSLEEIQAVGCELSRLLEGNDMRFDARWKALTMFCAARDFPGRHSSILLPFAINADAKELTADKSS